MRLTIDGAEEPVDYQNAVMAFYQVRASSPDQPVGNGGAIPHTIDNKDYLVVRNQDSYTVRVGGVIEDDQTLEGIPV